jgi:hypothetical protein
MMTTLLMSAAWFFAVSSPVISLMPQSQEGMPRKVRLHSPMALTGCEDKKDIRIVHDVAMARANFGIFFIKHFYFSIS